MKTQYTFAEMTAQLMENPDKKFIRIDNGPNAWKNKDGRTLLVFDKERNGIAISFNGGKVVADWKPYAADVSRTARYAEFVELDEVEEDVYTLIRQTPAGEICVESIHTAGFCYDAINILNRVTHHSDAVMLLDSKRNLIFARGKL